jgi:hypothetical protein
MKNTKDMVKRPSHYVDGRKYEPKDVIRDWGLNFNVGSAVKYLSRAGRKDDIVQDLRKAQEFIQFEIDAIEAEIKEHERKRGNTPTTDPLIKPEIKPEIKQGMVVIDVPEGTDPEKIINELIKGLYGGK